MHGFVYRLCFLIFRKTRGMPVVKNTKERLEIMDHLLYKFKSISSRKEFLKRVNGRLPFDQQISVFTLDNDLEYLREEIEADGVKLMHNKTRGFFYSDPEYSKYKQTLNDDDKVLLILAENLFQNFKETSLKAKFKELVDKVVARGGASKFWEDISSLNFIQLEGGYSSPGTKHLPDLIQYIYEQKSIRVKYGPEGGIKHLSPYVLKQNRGRWYLVAYDHSKTGAESIKIYSLDRMMELNDSPKPYYKDPRFSAEDYFKYSLGIWHKYDEKPIKVELEFTNPRLMETIREVHLHGTQRLVSKTAKKLRIEIEVYETVELETMILGYGKEVKIMSPKHLKERIQKLK
jgi:predicted DNA-binding transcriptional regulator YafY